MRYSLIYLLLFTATISFSQDKLVTVSGTVMDADSVGGVPYVNIRLKDTFFGTVADDNGHFAFTASEGDTLQFSSVGYFDAYFIMPEKLYGESYTLIQLMRKETVMLEEVVVFPWPEYEQLREAFISTQPNPNLDDVAFEAKKKIERISKEEYDRNKQYYNLYRNNQLYDMTGIIAPNDFVNPARWADFIRDVRNKKYKQDKK